MDISNVVCTELFYNSEQSSMFHMNYVQITDFDMYHGNKNCKFSQELLKSHVGDEAETLYIVYTNLYIRVFSVVYHF